MTLLSKSTVCKSLGICAKTFQKRIMKPEVLTLMGLDFDTYKKIRVFDAEQSRFLRKYLDIKDNT